MPNKSRLSGSRCQREAGTGEYQEYARKMIAWMLEARSMSENDESGDAEV